MEFEYLIPGERDELDANAPTVLEVTDPAHEAGALEPVEQERDGPRAQPRDLGEGTRRHGAVLVEEVDTPDVGGVQPEDISQRLVEGVRRRQESTKRPAHLLDTLLALFTAHDLP